MVKLTRYLKPFVGFIIISVMLLFVQAFSELALPDYMSDIVNVGIQQGGIENAVPNAIRKSQMDKLQLFLGDDKEEVLDKYTLIDINNEDYVDEYPANKNEQIYVLNEMSEEEIEELNPVMGKALLAVSGVEKMKSEAKDGMINVNGMSIPAETNLFEMFSKLPEEQRSVMSEDMNKQFTALGDKMIVQVAANAVKAEYTAIGMDTDKIQSSYIFKVGAHMILIAFLSAIATVMVGFLAAKIAAGLAKNLRKLVFSKVQGFTNTEFDKFSTASLITRTTNDINQIQILVVMIIRFMVYAPIMGIGGVIRALEKSTSMSWIIALAVIVLLGLIAIVFSIAIPKFKLIQKLVDKLNLVTRENLSGMMVIRAFNTQKFEEDRFDKVNKDLTKTNLFVNRLMVSLMPVMMLVMNGVSILIIWVGAHQISTSSMQVGDMMAFMQYAIQIIMAFLMLSVMFIMIPRASVSANRVVEILETEPSVVDPKEPEHFDEKSNGIVEFKDVSFKYPGADDYVLKDISFKAMPGQTTAIIGSTGSGKSTLINLIPRFYDISKGKLLVDGIDVKNTTQSELRDKIGYVPQKASLFKGTIESNLKYADENATNENIEESAKIAQAMEFINEKEEGFGSDISQGGSNVSGGQKQRLSIARAIVKNPDIYIFDDSFSALDFKTDAALRNDLKSKTQESTVIIVAQRISTIMDAEQIIVLDEGKIVGIGTHQELLNDCKTYEEIALSQLSKEELA